MVDEEEKSILQYNFDGFTLDESRSLLFMQGELIDLEPRIYELLKYFCHKPNQLITKDELIKYVWQNRIVTDNAVASAVAKLRKVLGDDSRTQAIIKTLPRKGYLFTPEVRRQKSSTSLNLYDEEGTNQRTSEKHRFAKSLLGVLTAIVFLSFLWMNITDYDDNTEIQQVVPVVRNADYAWYPSVSGNNRYLIFAEAAKESQSDAIVLKDLVKNHDIRYQPKGDLTQVKVPAVDANATKASWVEYQHKGQCRVVLSQINKTRDDKLKKTEIDQCHDSDDVKRIVFSKHGDSIFYTKKTTNESITGIYETQLDSSTNVNTTPFLKLKDASLDIYFFDVSENWEEMLILAKNLQSTTTILRYSLVDERIIQTTQLDYFLDRATYTQNGKSIVHPSKHPSYQLWQSNFKGKKERILATISNRIEFHSRIPGTNDLVFSAYLNNVDIGVVKLQSGSQTEGDIEGKKFHSVNSSVMDYLPAIQNKDNSFVFVSKRTGKAQIWMAEVQELSALQLTSFDKKYRFYQLEWSPDDEKLLAVTQNDLLVISVAHKQSRVLPLTKGERGQVWWVNNTTIGFNQLTSEGWKVFFYDLVSDNLFETNDKAQSYWRHALLLHHKERDVLEFVEKNCTKKRQRHQTVKLNNSSVYCFASKDSSLIRFDFSSHEIVEVVRAIPNFSFDLNDEQLIFSYRASLSADIMRTTK